MENYPKLDKVILSAEEIEHLLNNIKDQKAELKNLLQDANNSQLKLDSSLGKAALHTNTSQNVLNRIQKVESFVFER